MIEPDGRPPLAPWRHRDPALAAAQETFAPRAGIDWRIVFLAAATLVMFGLATAVILEWSWRMEKIERRLRELEEKQHGQEDR